MYRSSLTCLEEMKSSAAGSWRLSLLHPRSSVIFDFKTLRTSSGRAGAAMGASRASCTPECGTLCCRCGGLSSAPCGAEFFLFAVRDVGRRSAPHPAESERPWARAELRALRSAARSAAACGGLSSAPCGAEFFFFAVRGARRRSAPHPAEPELPWARAELRALRSAARSAAAVGD
jgi:hypothetical protein